ncbi:hypothetical protein AT269_00015, partial [Bacillus cereus]
MPKNKKCGCSYPRLSSPFPPQPICPLATSLNNSPECLALRDNLDGTPFQQGAFEFLYLDRLATFTEDLTRTCMNDFASDAHLANVQELSLVASKFLTTQSCPLLFWTTNNGIPTLAYMFPGALNPILI